MQNTSIENVFKDFEKLKVLIIGDVMIDSYLWGKVERISPEAPVPVVSVEKREKRLGGAANVAMNIKAMGAKPVLCAIIGKDADAEDFFRLLDEQNLSKEGIIKSENRITTIKHRILAGHQHMLRVDSEISSPITSKERKEVFEQIKQILPSCDVLIFEDYDKGILSKELIRQIIQLANKLDIPSVVDPKKRNFLHYHEATLFKPNLKELKEGLKIDFNPNNIQELKSAIALLKEKMNIQKTLVTLSEKGIFMDDGEAQYLLPAHLRSIADVSGAGDTVVSVAALCLALKLPSKLIAALANLAGGLVCEYVGVVSINKAQLLEEAINNQLQVYE